MRLTPSHVRIDCDAVVAPPLPPTPCLVRPLPLPPAPLPLPHTICSMHLTPICVQVDFAQPMQALELGLTGRQQKPWTNGLSSTDTYAS